MEKAICPCCQRVVREDDLTVHHYLPKCKGGTSQDTMTLCQTCHRALHMLIPIDDVINYQTIESLSTHEQFAKYLDWIKSRPDFAQYKSKKIKLEH